MTDLVRPQTLRGFRDILPEEMLLRNEIVDKVRRVYESYGYMPIDTPILELLPTLVGAGGAEADKQIFKLESPERQQVGMRFDLTVPFARIVAQYGQSEVRLPFRRYHIGPVFRADDPQPEQGRFRQFTQFDIDIAGTDSVAADAEVISVMSSAFHAIGLEPYAVANSARGYCIRINSRKLVDAFLLGLGIATEQQSKHIMRVIDKREKITEAELTDELGNGRVDRSGDPIQGVGLVVDQITSTLEFINGTGRTRRDVVTCLEKTIRPSPVREDAFAATLLLLDHLDALGVSDDAARFDPSLTRGLEYYTGPVFEGTIPAAGVGSVMGGGRYDGLVTRFLEQPIPATGASIGLDRLVTGLSNIGLANDASHAPTRVIVLSMSGVPASEPSLIAAELRASGVAAEVYLGEAIGNVRRQLAYANQRQLAIAVMVGEREHRDGSVTIKDLAEGYQARTAIATNEEYRQAGSSAGQRTVPRSRMANVVRELLTAKL